MEVVPGGDEEQAWVIDRVYIGNVTGLADVADYAVTSLPPDGPLREATVVGHRRSDGWRPLVRRAIETLWPDT